MRLSTIASLLVLVALFLPACATTPPAPPQEHSTNYILVTLHRGPKAGTYPAEEGVAIQKGHLENIGRLADQGILYVAGPYGQVHHDPTARGIFILNVPTIDQAWTATETDPAVETQTLVFDLAPFTTKANLEAAWSASQARAAELKKAGVDPSSPEEMRKAIRAYVVIEADDGNRAEQALATALPPGKLIIAGRVKGTRGFFVVDAPDISTVQGWLGANDASLGDHTFDEWWASSLLVQAGQPGA